MMEKQEVKWLFFMASFLCVYYSCKVGILKVKWYCLHHGPRKSVHLEIYGNVLPNVKCRITKNIGFKSRNNVIMALEGSKLCQGSRDKKMIVRTAYKVIGRSILNYAALIWSPQ